MSEVSDRQALHGSRTQQIRLISGLILFVFALTHFLNHAIGNVSLQAMLYVQDLRYAVWHSWLGTALLYGALIVHSAMALWKTARRRTWKMPAWEALQLGLGLAIPFLLLIHVTRTRINEWAFSASVDYTSVISIMWPGAFLQQTILMLLVWIHSCIGLHFWLRLKPWYQHMRMCLVVVAIALPIAATTGWTQVGRILTVTDQTKPGYSAEQSAILSAYENWLMLGFAGLLSMTVLAFALRTAVSQSRRRVQIHFPNGKSARVVPGPTLLEISRTNRVPIESVCGGRARCSTCRVLVMEGIDDTDPPTAAEARVLERIGAGKGVRLACQLRPRKNMRVHPLLSAHPQPTEPGTLDRYRWGVEQPVAVMFIDLRGFTRLSENRLPYDVVFILNRYVKGVTRVINQNGGLVDKVMGDGVMALFGINVDHATALRNALMAIVELEQEMKLINEELKSQVATGLRFGIGLHAGPAIIGRVGLEGGNILESGLTALGDTVNVASRLETATKAHNAFAIISTSILRQLGLSETVIGRTQQLAVRGRERPLSVTILDGTENLQSVLLATEPRPTSIKSKAG